MQGLESIGRGLARLRDFRWELHAQPMRELRLEVQIVFFSVRMPFGSGTPLNIPVLTMIKPVPSASGEAPTDRPA